MGSGDLCTQLAKAFWAKTKTSSSSPRVSRLSYSCSQLLWSIQKTDVFILLLLLLLLLKINQFNRSDISDYRRRIWPSTQSRDYSPLQCSESWSCTIWWWHKQSWSSLQDVLSSGVHSSESSGECERRTRNHIPRWRLENLQRWQGEPLCLTYGGSISSLVSG